MRKIYQLLFRLEDNPITTKNIICALENKERVYCEHCNEIVKPAYESEALSDSIGDVKFVFTQTVCKCSKCNNDCHYINLDEYNNYIRLTEYRKAAGIISLEQLQELPSKYGIAKRTLSNLLGWGETTFTRFYYGDIPSKEFSDILIGIYESPIKFKTLVNANRNRISIKAYEKCIAAIDRLLNNSEETDLVLIETACYICYNLSEISNTALQKLLYYIQGFYAGFQQKNCFSSTCYAWERGPVYPEIYKLFKDGILTSSNNEPLHPLLNPQLKVITDEVIRSFGCYSGDTLTQFTHSEEPWRKNRKEGDDDVKIPFDNISTYFQRLVDKRNMLSVAEIKLYAQEMFSMVGGTERLIP